MPTNRFELLTTWYLRFNGYFTTPDFTVHPDYRKQPGGTDADVLAVRFPHSEEYQARFNFHRDSHFVRKDRIDFLICEVKSGRCDINSKTWLDRTRKNVEYAIRWIGITGDNERLDAFANRIYDCGECDLPEERIIIRFVCFGTDENLDLKAKFPAVRQMTHYHIVRFLRERFTTNCCGIARQNWDSDIIEFADKCRVKNDEELVEWAKG